MYHPPWVAESSWVGHLTPPDSARELVGKAQVGQVQVEAPKVGASCQGEVEGCLEVQGEVALVGVPEEEGQEADLEVDLGEGQGVGLVVVLEVKVEVKALGVLAFQEVSKMEEPLEVVQEEGPWVAQEVVKVERVVVQEEVVLAWEVLVSEKEEQTVGEPAAVKKQ